MQCTTRKHVPTIRNKYADTTLGLLNTGAVSKCEVMTINISPQQGLSLTFCGQFPDISLTVVKHQHVQARDGHHVTSRLLSEKQLVIIIIRIRLYDIMCSHFTGQK